MEVLYDFKQYDIPKKGVFKITTENYGPDGWICNEEEYTIIGETELWYVYKLLPSGHGEWIGEKIIQHEYILPIGIHKSRFVRWCDYQLALFPDINVIL